MYESLTFDTIRTDVMKLERETEQEIDRVRKALKEVESGKGMSDVEAYGSPMDQLVTIVRGVYARFDRLDEFHETMRERAGSSLESRKLRQAKDKLADFRTDFSRLQKRIDAAESRLSLLGGDHAQREAERRAGMSGLDHVLRERNAIQNSERELDSVIGKAMETQSSLDRQRGMIERVSSLTARVNQTFPAIGKLMGMISRRKKTNEIIMGVWVGFLVCVFVYFVFL